MESGGGISYYAGKSVASPPLADERSPVLISFSAVASMVHYLQLIIISQVIMFTCGQSAGNLKS